MKQRIDKAFETVFRHTPVGVVLSDLHGTILDANDAFCSLLGRRREDVVERKLFAFMDGAEAEDARATIGRLRDEETSSVEIVRRWRGADARPVTTKVTASVVRTCDGEPIGGIAFVEDIGQRLLMASALADSEARYRRVVEDQTELIVRCLPDGTRTFVNQAYCRYAGASAEELVGRSFFPLIAEDDREIVFRKYAAMTPDNPVHTDEHRAVAVDGSLRWHRWIDRGIFDESGRLVEIQAVGRDITDERESAEQLRHRRQILEDAEVLARIGSWEWDPRTDRIFGSAGFWRIFTGEAGARCGTIDEVVACFRADLRLTVLWNLESLRTIGRRPAGADRDMVVIHPDGTAVVGRGVANVERNAAGEIVRVYGVVHDLTEQRRLEEAAQREREALTRADKMISLGVLVSGVAHEINNPNYAILLNASLLRSAWKKLLPLVDEEAARDSEVGEMIDDIEHGAERIRGIVTELRGFALDHDPGERAPLSLSDVVRSSLRLLHNHIRKATTRFSMHLASDLPLVAGNARRLEQVLVNLIINACQALEDDRRGITIETGVTDTHVYARVIDEGRGIAPDDLPKITEPFFTTKRAAGGSGLGLAVSERIAQEHDGQLAFESEPGAGTTATLFIPFAEARPE